MSNGGGMNQLEALFDEYLGKKAPALPANIKELLVNFAPWINLILIILAVPTLLAVLGITAYVSPFIYWAGVKPGILYYLSLAFLGITVLLRGLAIPGLFSRSLGAWRLLYYSMLLNLVYDLLSFTFIGGIISALIGLYFLFQVKSYYK